MTGVQTCALPIFSIPADIDDFTEELWENLDENNKISLFVRYTDLETGKYEQRIINKHV